MRARCRNARHESPPGGTPGDSRVSCVRPCLSEPWRPGASPRSPPHPVNVLSRHGSGQELRTNQLRVAQLHHPVTPVKQLVYWVYVNLRLTERVLACELVIFRAGYRRSWTRSLRLGMVMKSVGNCSVTFLRCTACDNLPDLIRESIVLVAVVLLPCRLTKEYCVRRRT